MTDVVAANEVDDRLALLGVEGDYARRFDTTDGWGWASLFTEDGVVAYYHVEYERTEDGWRIRNRVTVPFSVETTSRCGYQNDIALPGQAAGR